MLNVDGYDHRAYVDEGVLVPYHPPVAAESGVEAEEGAGAGADPEDEATKKVEASGDAAPPS